ncbi:MAG: preprotein translocase subunit SecE [Dehalococcoidales bacterium]|nr:preprotein translocase subunit SecE [Dehalococcoidales bacterium]
MARTTAKRRSSRFNFVSNTISELKKVVWLSKREVAYLTGLVLVVTIILGVFLGAIDYGFTNLVDKLFIGN